MRGTLRSAVPTFDRRAIFITLGLKARRVMGLTIVVAVEQDI